MDGSSPADLEEQMKQRSTRQYQQRWPGELSGCQAASMLTQTETKRSLVTGRRKKKTKKLASHCLLSHLLGKKKKRKEKKKEATQEMTWLKVNAAPFSCTTTLNPPLQLHMSRPALHSPLSQAFLGEARNDDGIKGLLCARNGDAQWSVISLQLHCVDYGA